MWLSIICGVVRALLAGFGGSLVQSGWLTADDVNQLVGAIILLITAGWSAWTHMQAHRKVADANDLAALATGLASRNFPSGPIEVRRATAVAVPSTVTPADRIAQGGRPEGGSASFAALFVVCLVVMVYLLLPFVVDRFAPVPGYHRIEYRAVTIQDPRPFWQRLLSSLQVVPATPGQPVSLSNVAIVGHADF